MFDEQGDGTGSQVGVNGHCGLDSNLGVVPRRPPVASVRERGRNVSIRPLEQNGSPGVLRKHVTEGICQGKVTNELDHTIFLIKNANQGQQAGFLAARTDDPRQRVLLDQVPNIAWPVVFEA